MMNLSCRREESIMMVHYVVFHYIMILAKPIIIDVAQLVVQEVVAPSNIAQEYLPEDKNSSDDWKGNGSGFS